MKAVQSDPPPSKERSSLMRSVKTHGTGPELRVCSVLDDLRFRYQRNVATLPGTPDIVLPRLHIVIFVHGCFWHGHEHCRKGITRPKTRVEFWSKKIQGNVKRDRSRARKLRQLGWSVVTVWECRCSRPESVRKRITGLINRQRSKRGTYGN
jgi:DNA mismatch endonuclease (patch repair protein)